MPRINNPLNLAGIPLGVGGFNSDLANFNFTEEITSTDNVCPVTVKRGDCIYWHPANAGTIENYTGKFYINTEEVQFPEMGMALILVDMRGIETTTAVSGTLAGGFIQNNNTVYHVFNIYINNYYSGAISFGVFGYDYDGAVLNTEYALISIAFSNHVCGVNMLSRGEVKA